MVEPSGGNTAKSRGTPQATEPKNALKIHDNGIEVSKDANTKTNDGEPAPAAGLLGVGKSMPSKTTTCE